MQRQMSNHTDNALSSVAASQRHAYPFIGAHGSRGTGFIGSPYSLGVSTPHNFACVKAYEYI